MQVYHEDLPPTRISLAIDALKGNRAQCCAAAIQLCLMTWGQTPIRLIMEPTRLGVAQIASSAGYSRAAVWHELPLIAAAGLIHWRKLDSEHVEVTWLMADESEGDHDA